MSIAGKTIVITGGSSGIGEAAAKVLAQKGAKLCLVARREDELARVKSEIEAEGGKCWTYAADLTDKAARDAACRQILEDHATVDVLINNAGRSIRRRVTEALDRFHDYERTMQINYFAAVGMTLNLLPRMLEQGHGHIISISTLSTLVPVPFFSAYVASKCALEGFSRSLYSELRDRGIDTTVIHYPLVKTAMTAPTKAYNYVKQDTPETAAEWIVRAVEKKPVRVAGLIGQGVGVATAVLPGFMTRGTGRVLRRFAKQLAKKVTTDNKSAG